jgi:class 3 adenylate cyclase/alpha-beta hydrolase superfamily lysophospholipase
VTDVPETRYAKTEDGVHIAYQVSGHGPSDVMFSPEWITHCEALWEHPHFHAALRRTASMARLILFDKRGIGLSDRVAATEVPSLETWVDDLGAVLDAAGSERPVLLGMGHGGALAMLFAATYPERTGGLILLNTYARLIQGPDYPYGYPPEVEDFVVSKTEAEWGATGWVVDHLGPSIANDHSVKEWFRRMERLACTPGIGAAMQRAVFHQDVRDVLPAIHAPTLVLHVVGNHHVRVEHGRYLARHIEGARYVELPGEDHWFTCGESAEPAYAELAAFLGAVPGATDTDRVLTTLVFSDVVQSTALANELGDRRWHELLDRLDDLAARQVERFRGRVVKSTGDGHLAAFDGAGRAVRCARVIVDGARALGLTMRSGVHTGEVELRGDDVAGIAVHLAQRVQSLAQPDEVLVSRTVVDLVAGSGIEFKDRGKHELKGAPGTWKLFAVEA